MDLLYRLGVGRFEDVLLDLPDLVLDDVRDGEVLVDEQPDRVVADLLLEGGFTALQGRGLDQDERVGTVLLGLGPDVVADVLDGQRVEVEQVGDPVDSLGVGFGEVDSGRPVGAPRGGEVVVLGDRLPAVDERGGRADSPSGLTSFDRPMAIIVTPTISIVTERPRPSKGIQIPATYAATPTTESTIPAPRMGFMRRRFTRQRQKCGPGRSGREPVAG